MNLKKIIVTFIFIILIGLGGNSIYAEELASMYEAPQFAAGEILLSQSKRELNAVNPTPYSNYAGRSFPGARGSNQLVLYTSRYGERTGTNEFGTEAIIEGNTVVELSGADSFIPENGAVLSGHGTAKNWINANITVGTKIYYDDVSGVITTYTTSQSYMFEALKKIDEANTMIDYYKMSYPGYDWRTPISYIREAENYMRKGEKNPNQMQKYSQLAIESANYAIKSVLPFRTNEFKGVWLRPTETSNLQITEAIKRLKEAGIDNIFIETYFHGRTIFPSKTMEQYGFISQNEKFIGFDPLRVWIEEAHKNNIKVHIWFETFYVGNMPPASHQRNILAVKPEWGNKTLSAYTVSGATPSASEHNGYFLDPSNPEVQEFLEKLLTEIITEYKPDGINLDYIRYPQSISTYASGNWGYTENARNMFNAQYGVDPVTLKTSDPLWYAWSRFRRESVTQFVKNIGILGRKHGIYVSAVIFPDKSVAYTRKLQDWAAWSQNHYINGFTPLFLTCDTKTLNTQISTVQNYKEPETDLFAGLFVTFMGGSEEDLIRQIHETRKLKTNGVIMFDYAHLGDKYIKALSARAFSSDGKTNIKKNDSFENTKTINTKTSTSKPTNLKSTNPKPTNIKPVNNKSANWTKPTEKSGIKIQYTPQNNNNNNSNNYNNSTIYYNDNNYNNNIGDNNNFMIPKYDPEYHKKVKNQAPTPSLVPQKKKFWEY